MSNTADSAVRSTTGVANIRRTLAFIRQDCAESAETFGAKGKLLTGEVIGEVLGKLLVDLHNLAGIVDAIVGMEHVVVPPGHHLVVGLPDTVTSAEAEEFVMALQHRFGGDRVTVMGGCSPITFASVGPEDDGPHSRACGYASHVHGSACSTNCPTCHGVSPAKSWVSP
jgi:hypothetical protein